MPCITRTNASEDIDLATNNFRHVNRLRKDVQGIHATLGRLCQHLAMDPPPELESKNEGTVEDRPPVAPGEEEDEDGELCELSPPASPSALQAPIDTFLENANTDATPDGVSPRLQRRKTLDRHDMITKGLITAAVAENLVHRYLTTLDPFLYGIASHHKDLESIRRASPTLLAAICAVAALHHVEDKEVFEVCNKEYRHLVASSLFEKRNLDFIRALCIGSFWLLNASRILSSDAIRRAADVRLHRHFYRIEDPSAQMTPEQRFEARDRVRLWYLLFVCDQHLSILHNRDCLTRQEQDIIEQRDNFLVGDTVARQDVRIISQVSLLRIMGQIRDAFGAEITKPLPKGMAIQLTHFLRELDQWYQQFLPLFGMLHRESLPVSSSLTFLQISTLTLATFPQQDYTCTFNSQSST